MRWVVLAVALAACSGDKDDKGDRAPPPAPVSDAAPAAAPSPAPEADASALDVRPPSTPDVEVPAPVLDDEP